MTKTLRSFMLAACVAAVPLAHAAEGEVHLDKAPLQFDQASLANGAKLFINYCLNCHGASSLRYNKLEEIGLTEDQIRDNLLFTADKVGDQMKVALRREDGKAWFGAAPPDLTLIARARASEAGSGPDWLYTYLRKFYRDDARPTGWNNLVFPNVGMPHVLWELQGEQAPKVVTKDGHQPEIEGLELVKPGKMSSDEYDENIADLVSFITWMGEPAQESRKTIGWFVLAVLALLAVLVYLVKRSFWKDVH
ncbi:MAG: cytochrome c1 [Rhodocyclaceae bacterium]